MDGQTMPAGPELDALIAEKVMGLVPCSDPIGRCEAAHMTPCQCWRHPDESIGSGLRCYSTRIEDAWEVIERMAEKGWRARLLTPFTKADPVNWCGFTPHGFTGWNGRPDHESGGPTMPEAVCRAALLVVGVS